MVACQQVPYLDLALPALRARILYSTMLKALCKSKRVASETDCPDRDHMESNPITSMAATTKAMSGGQLVAWAHSKSGHCSIASTQDERHRDLALQKICHKASKDKVLQLTTRDESGILTAPASCPRSPGITPDQVSLRD